MAHPESAVKTQTAKTFAPTARAARTIVAAPAGEAVVAVAAKPHRLRARVHHWVRVEGAWWATSFIFHMFLMSVLMVIGSRVKPLIIDEAPTIEEVKSESSMAPPQLEEVQVGDAPLDPSELTTETLTLTQAPGGGIEQTEVHYDDNPIFSERGGGMPMSATSGQSLGGLGGFDIRAIGPGVAVQGKGGVGIGVGTGTDPGSGGSGIGFGSRGTGHRKAMVAGFGGTRASERAVAAALSWLARHQRQDGSWSLVHNGMCKDSSCTGPGGANADAGATAMGLLPFLAAGQTHESKGPYQQTIRNGLYWLMKHQGRDGDLSAGAPQKMYSHGLAAIALCEAHGLTNKKDKLISRSAQAAVNFIQSAQHPTTGGWRYNPGDEGDVSVVGWQVMALKSAQMAGLSVNPRAFEGAKQFLRSCSRGGSGGQFSYTPGGSPTPAMTSVGLLCCQYMGTARGDPLIVDGLTVLMSNMPDKGQNPRELYYWYYATQVMHNMPGPEWDKWNRQMRKTLIETQVRTQPKVEGGKVSAKGLICAEGSWDPDKPSRITWSEQGGRLMVTSLSALTLEVYYRYLPLFKLDADAAINPAAPFPAAPAPQPPAAPPAGAPVVPPPAAAPAPQPPAAAKG